MCGRESISWVDFDLDSHTHTQFFTLSLLNNFKEEEKEVRSVTSRYIWREDL
jgi:hypothetical protein